MFFVVILGDDVAKVGSYIDNPAVRLEVRGEGGDHVLCSPIVCVHDLFNLLVKISRV